MTYRTEFPDFPPADMPDMPEGFADHSWHNDAMPWFWNEARRLAIWVNYVNYDKREIAVEGNRFLLEDTDEEGAGGKLLAASDDWSDILKAVAEHRGQS